MGEPQGTIDPADEAPVPEAPGTVRGGRGDVIELVVPLAPEHAATVRMVAASLAADAGFSVDEIDDVRLGISEVFGVLAEGATGRCRATFQVDGAVLTASLSSTGAAEPPTLDELAESILRAVVDSCEVGDSTVTIVKHATEAAGQRS